jgi:hypothetical protein
MRRPRPGDPDLILHGGPIHTVDPRDAVVDAVAIRDGRFVAVGAASGVRGLAGDATRVVDLAGAAVVPGFVDGHPHMDGVGLRLLRPSFGAPASIDQILAIVKAEASRRRAGDWIVGNPIADEPEAFRYPQALREGRWPTRHDLDAVAPVNPVFITPPILMAPGVAIANSAALQLAGITKDTRPPPGVEIERSAGGEPTGVFFDTNFPKLVQPALFPMLPAATHETMVEALRLAMRAFNAAGVTAIYEGHGIGPAPQRAYLELWSKRALTVRTYFVIAYPIPMYRDPAAGDALIRETSRYAAGAGFGDDWLKFGGLGFSFDSASAIGASLMREPYVGARGERWHGVQHTSDENFHAILAKGARANVRMQVQCSGGLAIDKVLAMYEAIDREIPLAGRRWVIEHCQFPSAQNMETCRRLGVIPTSTTNFLWLYGSVYLKCWDRALVADSVPFKAWLDAGVPAVQSTDGRPFEPLFTFWQSLARRDSFSGETLSTPRQRLTRQEALRLYTAHGAWATFWEDRLGSIEPGKLADLVVLSDDIMTIPEDRIPDTRVVATLVGGRPVHDTGMFAGMEGRG